ncbi:peptide/nickel transport system ATP-binding protein [Actinoplanes tereljensis]|uniref:ABC transporter ATP-binding protein n=1 Tax=Paractinoplanes tereljensis TaxID=571912 RepID=A0A919TX28_9ACTN|nr:ABC transporter ATP-binding protein [Actinoplanes tereljensis]GIF23840.1 putative ABC transporter ATP-binding protein [Actinoplanes tereljensis]
MIASVDDLHVSLRGNPVLRGVSLSVRPGEILGLVGESGSGKSVLALTLMGLLPPDAHPQVTGTVEVAGVDMMHGSAAAHRGVRRRELGVIFQDPMTSLNPTMRIGRQITEVTRDTDRAVQLLEHVGVADAAVRLRVYPHELSGGLRQRVMTAIAVAGRPSLIIADEPTTALDVTVQAQVLSLLRDLRDEYGCSVLFITHDLAVAAQITDRIGVLYAGRLAELGPTRELLAHPTHPYTAGLLRSRLSLTTPRGRELPTLPAEAGPRGPGCAYHTRCPLAVDRCATEQPPLVGDEHQRACWRDISDMPDGTSAAEPGELGPAVEGSAVVRLHNIRCDFKLRNGWRRAGTLKALDGVDLEVAPGEAVSIVGESGSGKSTLLRVIAGLIPPTGGTREVTGGTQMVFQDAGSSLTPWLTIGELLRERLLPLKLSRAEQDQRVRDALTKIGLPATVATARPRQLSGGQRQRVALARATIVPPAVLLCDEPTSALDASLAASVLNLIRQLRADLGMAVVFVTHDLAVARLMGDRIVVMTGGHIAETGPADDLVSHPQADYTKTLLAAVPEIAI